MKNIMIRTLILILIISCFNGGSLNISAAKTSKKITLSHKKISLKVGKKKTVRLKNVKKKVKWKVNNKKIAKIIKKKGKYTNTIRIKGIKKGKTKITATCGKKKYTIKISVKKQSNVKNNNKEEITTNIIDDQIKFAQVNFETYGSGTIESITVKVGEPYGKLPQLKASGRIFHGWQLRDGTKITETTICTGDVTLYADLEVLDGVLDNPILEVPIFFETDGLVDIDHIIVMTQFAIGELPQPEVDGYTFIGWFTENNIEVTETTICKEPMILYGKFVLNIN